MAEYVISEEHKTALERLAKRLYRADEKPLKGDEARNWANYLNLKLLENIEPLEDEQDG